MDLTQIRYFLALAQTRNFTRAAELSNVTQPALSRAIQKLEEELGGPLVLRERALTQLTELGRTMLPLLQQTFDAAETVRLRAAEHRRGGDAAPLRLGLAPEVAADRLEPLLREVAARVEGFQLALLRREQAGLVESLLDGALHLAVLPQAATLPDRLATWPLWTGRVLLLVPEGHALAAAGVVAPSVLADQPLLRRPGAALPPALAALAAGAPAPPHEAGGLDEAMTLVRLGLGLALVPDGVAAPAGTVALPFEGMAGELATVLAAPAGRPMNRAVGAFAKLARARAWGRP